MNNNQPPIAIFVMCGLASGLLSCLSFVVPGLVVFIPGFLFGGAICFAIQKSLTPIAVWQQLVLIVVSGVAYFLAGIGGVFFGMNLLGVDNGLFGGAIVGAISGCIGATLLVFPLITFVEESQPELTLLLTPLVGTILGSAFIVIGVFIADHTSIGHPWGFFFVFPLWQGGVAATIGGLCDPSLARVIDSVERESI
ncbi:hypothetical protein KOR42_46360 [Thalassoglobus neptunius]|uniref:Uncharacterized protein n=1 Tax=Thalassoglobus neptunius TaxID=1938619 RepID=A0A5C5VYG1_9PLAN|nr:hypothetical protein [Thalassoglobus neptunius]TWT42781.1 hypothetical protein KOR42_46360 [Thalassoglobus neptunius]